MIRMHVAGLSLDEATKAPILVLKKEDSDEVLPIWIGAMEAMAISIVINEVSVPRPLTHDLMLSMMGTLGAELNGIEIVGLKEGTYYAELDLSLGGERRRVDCRPSDAIALALRAEVPILVDESVLEDAARDPLRPLGQAGEDLPQPQDIATKVELADNDDEKLSELLKNFEPETKYKM